MKKFFGKIILLITAACMLFSFAACAGDPPPAPKEYTQEEVIATAVENTLKEKDIKIRADATAYIPQFNKNVPTTVEIDVKNQNGKIDFAASYAATTTVAMATVTVSGNYTYKDGILYMPAYDGNGDIYSDRVSTRMVDLSFEDLLTPDASGATPLSQALAMLAEQGETVVKPQNGVYTFEAKADAKLALTVLKTFVLTYKDVQIGDMIAAFLGEEYTREELVEDLTDIFESPTLGSLAHNIDTLFAHIGLEVTMKDIGDALLAEMGYTKNDIYYLVSQYMEQMGLSAPKPTAQETAYEYAIRTVGIVPVSLLEQKLEFSMAKIKALVIDGYLDNDDCTFGVIWDTVVGYLDEAIVNLSMLLGIDAQIEPPFLSCANLVNYTVNACKGSVKITVDEKTLRLSALAFTIDTDIDCGSEKIKTYIEFDGNVTYGETVTIAVPDKFILPCVSYDAISYDMLKAGAPWSEDLAIRVFIGDCTETGAEITVFNASEELDYEVTLTDGVLYIPAALLDDMYVSDTSCVIELSLPSGDDSVCVLWVFVNPQGDEWDWIGL